MAGAERRPGELQVEVVRRRAEVVARQPCQHFGRHDLGDRHIRAARKITLQRLGNIFFPPDGLRLLVLDRRQVAVAHLGEAALAGGKVHPEQFPLEVDQLSLGRRLVRGAQAPAHFLAPDLEPPVIHASRRVSVEAFGNLLEG